MRRAVIKKALTLSVSGLACLSVMAGCSSGNSANGSGSTSVHTNPSSPLSRQGMERTVRDDGYRVDAALSRFNDRDSIRAGGTQVSSGIFLGVKAKRRAASASLPSQFESANAVTLTSREPMRITDIAGRLSEVTGVHHLVSLGPTGVNTSGTTAQSNVVTLDENGSTLARPQNYVSSQDDGSSADILKKTMIPQLRGPLSNILDEISATFDVEWEYKDGRIVFRDYITRQYQIASLPSATQASTSVGSSGGSAGSSMSVSTSSNVDVWSDVRESIGGLVGAGGNISLSPSTGMVTVTAKAGDQDRVESYIRDLNSTTGQQISFDVNVLTVNLTGGRNHGISLDSVFNSGGAGGNTVIGTEEDGAVNIGIVSGNFSIGAVVKALEKYGNVSIATRAGTTTSNNKVTPVNVTDITTYVAGMETNSTGTNTTVSTPQIEEIETGFQIQLLPRVMNNREIMVQYALRLSELTSLESITYAGGVQQLPRISETAMEQQAVLRNGQTLVLSGFERDRTEVSDSGYDLRMAGVGGATAQEKSRVSTVVLITPRIIDRQDLARR